MENELKFSESSSNNNKTILNNSKKDNFYNKYKHELKLIFDHIADSIKIRTKFDWYKQGEKSVLGQLPSGDLATGQILSRSTSGCLPSDIYSQKFTTRTLMAPTVIFLSPKINSYPLTFVIVLYYSITIDFYYHHDFFFVNIQSQFIELISGKQNG